MRKHLLEICASNIESVAAAIKGGADRIELCQGLSEGGLTPSYGLIRDAVESGKIIVNVLIRPRGGDFLYSEAEIRTMTEDIKLCRKLGANGVVSGVLDRDGNVDKEACRRLIEAADGLEFTFHRAFDMCADPDKALEDIIALGCNYILTSGISAKATDGIENIRRAKKLAGDRIRIIACGGVNSLNTKELIEQTGADDLHASAKRRIPSAMIFKRGDVKMGNPDFDEYSYLGSDPEEIKAIASIIKEISE